MHFELSDEQIALQEIARDFLASRWPADRVRAALDDMPACIEDGVWKEIVEMGWLGVAAPESAGGIGGDVLTAAVLAEQGGHGLLPGPLLSSIVASIALDRGSSVSTGDSLLAAVIAGETRVTVAYDEPGARWTQGRLETRAATAGDGFRLDGTKILVPDAEDAEILLVAAQTDEGPGWLCVRANAPGVSIQPMRRLDAQSISEVTFDAVAVDRDARLVGTGGAASVLAESLEIWTTLCAADLLGTAEAALAMTVDFARERVQFERPIGSFQAVSHRLADVKLEIELARSLLYAACLALDEGRDNAVSMVSAAKATASDAAVHATEAALHLHGGVGFTWEYDVHLHLRRARANAATRGDADFHRDRIASAMEAEFGAESKG